MIEWEARGLSEKDIFIPLGDVLINSCGILYVVTQTIQHR